MSSKRIGPFLGLNNTRPLTQLEQFERGQRSGDFMRSADNVDVTDAGTLRRRQGWAKRLGGTQMRGLFALDDGSALVADYNQLCRLTYEDDELSKQVLMADLRPGAPISYTDTPLGTYLSDGYGMWVYRDGEVSEAMLDTPNPPYITAMDGGSLPGGLYQVACTFVRSDGLQSCASEAVQVEVPDNGLMYITLPATTQAMVAAVDVFMTPVNGDTLLLVERVPVGTPQTAVYALPDEGPRCTTQHFAPLPPGSILRLHEGRLWVANGAAVFHSQPYAYGLHDPTEDFLFFPAEVTLLEPVSGGVFIVADKTYLLTDDGQKKLQEVLPYGAPPGTAARRSGGGGIYWMSHRGLILATDDGQVKNLHEGVLAIPKSSAASVVVREEQGMEQVVAATQSKQGNSVAVAKGVLEAQIIKQGVFNGTHIP